MKKRRAAYLVRKHRHIKNRAVINRIAHLLDLFEALADKPESQDYDS